MNKNNEDIIRVRASDVLDTDTVVLFEDNFEITKIEWNQVGERVLHLRSKEGYKRGDRLVIIVDIRQPVTIISRPLI